MPDTRRVSAVEGTKLDVAFQLNKPVKSATLVAKDGTEIPLAVDPQQGGRDVAGFRARGERDLRAEARRQRRTREQSARAVRRRCAAESPAGVEIRRRRKATSASRRSRRSPSARRRGTTSGCAPTGSATRSPGRPKRRSNSGATRAGREAVIAHLLKLEELGVKPDELVSWFLWAEDVGPDGKPRRTATDMFFAEVRPFEEIYRRAGRRRRRQQGQGGRASEAAKLAKMQKQIISATWNLQRARGRARRRADVGEVSARTSRWFAIRRPRRWSRRTSWLRKSRMPKAKALVENAIDEMQTALDHLTEAATTPAPLPDALTAEQAAYNALLKLAAHEFRDFAPAEQPRRAGRTTAAAAGAAR